MVSTYWKKYSSNWIISPGKGKNIWNHHLDEEIFRPPTCWSPELVPLTVTGSASSQKWKVERLHGFTPEECELENNPFELYWDLFVKLSCFVLLGYSSEKNPVSKAVSKALFRQGLGFVKGGVGWLETSYKRIPTCRDHPRTCKRLKKQKAVI